jgi:hypothetical protein
MSWTRRKRVPPLILHISFASIPPDGLASSQIEIYPDKFGWKWKADSEIFPSRILVPEFEKHAGRFTGNDVENRRTAGAAVLRFLAE